MYASTITIYGNTSDSLKIVTLQREVSNLKVSVSRLQQENRRRQKEYEMLQGVADSLKHVQNQQARGMDAFENNMREGFSVTNQNLQESKDTLSDSINNRTWMAVCGILIALASLGVVFFILKKKISSGSSAIDKMKSAQEELEKAQKAMQEESVKLDGKLVELLDKQMNATLMPSATEPTDHKLALKVADEIVRIEMNLSKMDSSIRGYKQLKYAVSRIRSNFSANGYEIVEMLGKPYNEGIKASVSFESDESLEEGEQRITGIIKPQINYKGKMIQSAQITVSQNL